MKQFDAQDAISVSDSTVTPEGFLVVPGRLARTGVQDYAAYELGMEGDAMRIVRLYRPPEEVFSPDSMASFEGKPVTVDHPNEPVTVDNWKAYAVGEVSGIHRAGDMLAAKTICIKDGAAIAALKSGKRELSNGYRFTLDLTAGVTPQGAAYDGIQRNIRGNHIALVDAARCGSACRISDSTNPLKGNQPMTTRTVVVDGIPHEVPSTAAAVIEKLVKDGADALQLSVESDKKVSDAAKAHVAVIEKLNADHATAMDALRKDVITPEARDALVADWAKMLNDAKRLAPDVTTDGKTCLQVRREVIAAVTKDNATALAVVGAVLAGTELDKAAADTVRTAFNALSAAVTDAKPNTEAHKAVADALLGLDSATVIDAHGLFSLNLTQGA
jgi:uncharacterized protein